MDLFFFLFLAEDKGIMLFFLPGGKMHFVYPSFMYCSAPDQLWMKACSDIHQLNSGREDLCCSSRNRTAESSTAQQQHSSHTHTEFTWQTPNMNNKVWTRIMLVCDFFINNRSVTLISVFTRKSCAEYSHHCIITAALKLFTRMFILPLESSYHCCDV